MCGAGWRNSVFKLVVTKKSYVPLYGESSEGCFKDARNRDLPTLIRWGYGDPKKCFKRAMENGF
jgi:hypothetical protein